MKKHLTILSVILAVLLTLLCASCSLRQPDESQAAATASADETTPLNSTAITVDADGATQIVLNGSTAAVTGSGAVADGAVVRIESGGVYSVRGTMDDGQILVDADDADVTILLEGADITCAHSSAIYIYSAKQATVYAAEGTENTLTDGSAYTYNDTYASQSQEEPNACLYAKDDLILAGSGTLTVNGRYANGIVCKDDLQIESLTLTVQAANNGVTGKDSLTIRNANVTVTAQADALRSTNDTDDTLGSIVVTGAALDLTSGEDGIQAQTNVTLSSTDLTVRAGGGSGNTVSDDSSAKGVKAGGDIAIDSGSFTLDCADDGVHADGSVTIRGGTMQIDTGDNGVHAENTLTVEDGSLTISGHEGLEATLVTINGGTISIQASDDGINAAQKISGVTPTVTITGGEVTIEMGQGDTDGIDANGDIIIAGGTVRVTAQSPFDYDGKGELNGGTVYVNGEQVTELTNQFGGMMGGRGGMPDGEGSQAAGGFPGKRGGMPDGEQPSGGFPGRGEKERMNSADASSAA